MEWTARSLYQNFIIQTAIFQQNKTFVIIEETVKKRSPDEYSKVARDVNS